MKTSSRRGTGSSGPQKAPGGRAARGPARPAGAKLFDWIMGGIVSTVALMLLTGAIAFTTVIFSGGHVVDWLGGVRKIDFERSMRELRGLVGGPVIQMTRLEEIEEQVRQLTAENRRLVALEAQRNATTAEMEAALARLNQVQGELSRLQQMVNEVSGNAAQPAEQRQDSGTTGATTGHDPSSDTMSPGAAQ
jgi:hypothetical protein